MNISFEKKRTKIANYWLGRVGTCLKASKRLCAYSRINDGVSLNKPSGRDVMELNAIRL